jgi:hypothetical protein
MHRLAANSAHTYRAQHRDEALRNQEREQPANIEIQDVSSIKSCLSMLAGTAGYCRLIQLSSAHRLHDLVLLSRLTG